MVGATPRTGNMNPKCLYRLTGRPSDIATQVGLRSGRNGHKNKAFDGVNAGSACKKTSPCSMVRALLQLIKHCRIDDARQYLKEQRAEMVEWLKLDGDDTRTMARDMQNMAKRHCHMVPDGAELLIKTLADAGRTGNIQSIARSDSEEIARMAERALRKMR